MSIGKFTAAVPGFALEFGMVIVMIVFPGFPKPFALFLSLGGMFFALLPLMFYWPDEFIGE